MLEWLCLVIQDHGRSRLAGSTHKILGLCSLLVRVVGYKVNKNLNPRPGGQFGKSGEYWMGRMGVV
jgi:hypothetical protein